MEFRILGLLEVWHNDLPIDVGGERQRALLALLLLNAGQVVSSDRLIDELWGDDPPQTGVKALQMRVSELRKSFEDSGIEDAVVVTRSPGYLVEMEPDQLDLQRFERLVREGEQAAADGDSRRASVRLREALALWRGPPLADCQWAPFAHAAANRLDELRLEALEKRIDADLALGAHEDILGELRELVAAHPFRERFRAQLVLALRRSGDQAGAITEYRAAEQTLLDELGIEPSASLRELGRRVESNDPSLDLAAPAASTETQAEQPPAVSIAPAERSILVVTSAMESLHALLAVATSLTKRPRRDIIVASLVATSDELDEVTTLLHNQTENLSRHGVEIRTAAFTSADRGSDLVKLTNEEQVDLLLTDAPPELTAKGTPPSDLETVLDEAPCDVATLVLGEDSQLELGERRPIMVPFGGSEHEWTAVEIGAWLAAASGATLRLLGSAAQPDREKRDASRLLAGVSLLVQRYAGITAKPLVVPPGEDAILDAAKDAGLLVIGLSERWPREGLGAVRLALAQKAAVPTIFVRRGLRPGGLAPLENLSRYTWSLSDSTD